MWDDSLRVTRLLTAVEAVQTAVTRTDVIEVIRMTSRRLIGSDGVTVVLREGDHCHYIEEDAIAPLWKGQRFLAEACISGWAMIREETAVVADIAADARMPYHLYRGTFVRSMVMAPMPSPQDGGAIGAIGAYWSEAHAPSEDAITIVETLARFSGLVLARVSPPAATGSRDVTDERARE